MSFENRENIRYLGEDDFRPFMETAGKEWLKTSVVSGNIETANGTKLNYYKAVPQDPRGAVVIIHGFCEFWGKYHEMAYYLWQAGYAVYFCEHRGHGYSGGKLPEPDADIVYIDDYQTYVRDLKCFLDNVVVPETDQLRKTFLAHSMGGAVAALFLENYAGYADAVIFSSPMFMFNTGKFPAWLASAYGGVMKLIGKGRSLAPGEKRFSPEPVFERSSTLSKARYHYQFDQRLRDRHYQTYGASCAWVAASLKADSRLLSHADRIQIPAAILTAGQDRLVKREGFERFMQKAPQTKEYAFADSRHEIFNAGDETRKAFFDLIFRILDEGI
ncbi:MAG: alpha/beta fold hydrolase [Lachnospiraceae bacterium]|nr:alpha/beta fold hydrolase [Lachnospiraceae bacterium]